MPLPDQTETESAHTIEAIGAARAQQAAEETLRAPLAPIFDAIRLAWASPTPFRAAAMLEGALLAFRAVGDDARAEMLFVWASSELGLG